MGALVLQIRPNKSDLVYLSQAFEDCLVLDGLLEKHNNDFGLYRIVYIWVIINTVISNNDNHSNNDDDYK